MDARLQALLDRAEITALVHAYCNAADRHDHDKMRALYHDDATDDHGAFFKGLAMEFIDSLPAIQEPMLILHHNVTTVNIALDGDYAEGEIYVCNNSPPRGRISARNEQFKVIAEEAAKLGLVQIGYGEFPVRGAEEGFSCVAIFRYPDDRLKGVPYSELRTTIDELCKALEVISQQAFASPMDASQ